MLFQLVLGFLVLQLLEFHPDAGKVVKMLTGKEIPTPRVATLRKINNINTSELIDEGLIIWFPGPESYTGENMAEIHIHGGKAVVISVHKQEISKVQLLKEKL